MARTIYVCDVKESSVEMITKFLTRYFHMGANVWAAQNSALATLRKKTGYTFANCKKALEMHDNDITKAESWLKEQAQSLGWSKATKLQGRQTTQGLVGVMIKDNVGAMVEVNCETDFVARNENFQDMVELATRTCVQLASVSRGSSDSIFKIALDKELLQTLKTSDGKPLSDCLALMIGTVGENATLRRAMFFKAENNVQLFGYAHPTGITKGTSLLGRVGGIIAVRHTSGKLYEIEETAKKLCQHIVGMAPKKIGTADDVPQKDKDEETCLIHQEYLHDDGVTVGEVLEENKLEVLDFMRFECGEENGTERTLEGLKTCQ